MNTQVNESIEHARTRAVVGSNSDSVIINTSIERTDDGLIIVSAKAQFHFDGELSEATSARTFESASLSNEQQVIDASKRDALRELVTQLQMHGVL